MSQNKNGLELNLSRLLYIFLFDKFQQRKIKQYVIIKRKGSDFMNDYERTVQAIKDLDKIPSKSEWNKIAMQYNFLSTRTLRVISNMSFIDFCKSIRKR